MPSKIITYLIYFFKYLDDKHFEDLLKLIYGKYYFINIYETSKELFLHAILQKLLPLDQGKISIHEYTKEYANIDDYEEDEPNEDEVYLIKEDSSEEISKNVKIYGKIFSKQKNQVDIFTPKHLENKLNTDIYNDDYLNLEGTEELLLRYISEIINSLDSFKINLNTSKDNNINQKRFKQYINKSIQQIIKKKFFYTFQINNKQSYIIKTNIDSIKLYEPCINKEKYIIRQRKDGLHISDENDHGDIKIQKYTVIANSSSKNNLSQSHALIGAKSLKSYLNSNKYMDIAIAELKKQNKEQDCHICNPITRNSKNKKKHKCDTCKAIYSKIRLITKNEYTTKHINEKIKSRIEKRLEFNKIRETHYNKLISLLEEISLQYKDNYVKYADELNGLVDSIFGDFKK